jgi:pyruvate/2-oxoglutarate/acetoin dehydrogenase E1 component
MTTYVDAVRMTLRDALASDDSVILLGEDIGFGGGAFRATTGLLEEFGPDRVRDTPIAEGAFTGLAVGLALEGRRPVVEFQFADFLTCGFTAIVNTAAKMYFRTGMAVPMVIRAPAGGGFAGGPFHSQNPEAWFLRAPGLKVACPATVEDVGPILAASIADPNPVIVLEQKNLYTRLKGEFVPGGTRSQLGGATVRRAGTDVTVVTYGAALHLVEAAAEELQGEISLEVIDLRILSPLDWDSVASSVRKTNRLLVAHEDYADYGVGAEVAARAAELLFEELDAPVQRVGARFNPIPFSPPLEAATLPSVSTLVAALRRLDSY